MYAMNSIINAPKQTTDIDTGVLHSNIADNIQETNEVILPNQQVVKKEPSILHTKVSQLRDSDIQPVINFGKSKYNVGVAVIRINNSYKIISSKNEKEYDLIVKMHDYLYGKSNHFSLEYVFVPNVNIDILGTELDQYNFMVNDSENITDDIESFGESIKQLHDVKVKLGLLPKKETIHYKPLSTRESNKIVADMTNKSFFAVFPPYQSACLDVEDNIKDTIKDSNLISCQVKSFDKLNSMYEDFESVEPTLDMKRTMDIWYNKMFMNGNVIEWQQMLTEFGLSTEQIINQGYFKELMRYKTIDIDGILIEKLNELFNEQLFKDEIDFKKCVDDVMTNNNKYCPNLAKIKQYILANYDLDNKVENRIQFTTLLNDINKGLYVSGEFYEMMKKSLPFVLTDLKLNKKRFTNGFFWYGLKKKNQLENDNDTNVSTLTSISTKKEDKKNVKTTYYDIIKTRGYSNDANTYVPNFYLPNFTF